MTLKSRSETRRNAYAMSAAVYSSMGKSWEAQLMVAGLLIDSILSSSR